jgi:hypothetical protein
MTIVGKQNRFVSAIATKCTDNHKISKALLIHIQHEARLLKNTVTSHNPFGWETVMASAVNNETTVSRHKTM